MGKLKIVSTSFLFFLTYLFFTPLVIASSESAKVTVRSIVGVNLSITASSNNVNFQVTPTSQGSLITKNLNITVSTNSDSGYTLSMSNQDDNNSLITSGHGAVISSITTPDLPAGSFPLNSWGYSLDNLKYQPIPKLAAINLTTTDLPTNTSVTALSFATKVSQDALSGNYQDTIIFSAVANPAHYPTFSGIKNLQDMTTRICNTETTPLSSATQATLDSSNDPNFVPEAELRDTRDNKTYIVRKLADGKCWITQNLDLDLNAGVTLTSQNTDLNSKTSWTPNNSTHTSTGIAWTIDPSGNQAHSYDPGNIYYTGTSSPQPSSSSGPKYAHAGNYYNWYAATAGSGTYSMLTPGQEAEDSICPKGWKLPYGNNQTSYSIAGGDYRILTNTYDITKWKNTANTDSGLLTFPLHFVRNGYYYYSNGQVNSQGTNGYIWSSSVYSHDHAHSLYFYSGHVSPQTSHHKGYGFPVRCIVR